MFFHLSANTVVDQCAKNVGFGREETRACKALMATRDGVYYVFGITFIHSIFVFNNKIEYNKIEYNKIE